MSAKMTPTKRFAVRTALVTSTTLATIIGAQTLMSIDEATILQVTPIPTEFASQATAADLPQVSNPVISAAAPNIVILRRAGEQPSNTQAINPPASAPTTQIQIAPPTTVLVAPPQPIFQQIIPSTRASR